MYGEETWRLLCGICRCRFFSFLFAALRSTTNLEDLFDYERQLRVTLTSVNIFEPTVAMYQFIELYSVCYQTVTLQVALAFGVLLRSGCFLSTGNFLVPFSATTNHHVLSTIPCFRRSGLFTSCSLFRCKLMSTFAFLAIHLSWSRYIFVAVFWCEICCKLVPG